MNRIEAIIEFHQKGKKINVIGLIISLITVLVGFFQVQAGGVRLRLHVITHFPS